MSSEFRLVPRTEIGLPQVVTSDGGSPRPGLRLCRYYTGHYTGVDVIYGDIGDTPAEIRAVHDYSVRAKKPFEYNYVIGTDEDDLVYEYAGPFQAAHSAGENGISIGVLFMLGTNEYPTDTMIRKWQWLRDVLVWFQVLANPPEQRPHREMPGAATACFGPHLYARWPQMLQKYQAPQMAPLPPTPPPPPPPPPPTTPPPVGPGIVQGGRYTVLPNDNPWKVSTLFYGTGTRWPEIVAANADDPVMNPGDVWIIPGYSGKMVTVQDGWGAWSCIRAAGFTPTNDGVSKFMKWNGGPDRTLRVGDVVFVEA